MTKYLSQFLNVKEPLFSNGMAQLEKVTGNMGIDTRLIADITEKSHLVLRKLKLDVSDTKAHELYAALMATVEQGAIEELLLDDDYVMFKQGDHIVSMNVIDVIENSHYNTPFGRQIIKHGQRSLMGEIVNRYVAVANTNEAVARDLAAMIGILPEA